MRNSYERFCVAVFVRRLYWAVSGEEFLYCDFRPRFSVKNLDDELYRLCL